MKLQTKIFAAAFLITLFPHIHAADINGAGSSAAAPLYKIWGDAYSKTSNVSLDYQAVGSSAGIKLIKERSVDFGASDVALSSADLKKEKLIQFPAAISGVIPVINIPGIRTGELKLTGYILARIFSREITRWNDAAIAELNPRLSLPNKNIEVIARLDGSGTTYNFTDYLSKMSMDWKTNFGTNFLIKWSKDVTQIKGSSAISEALRKTPYSISYIDFNYVIKDKLDYALIKNRDGKFPLPSAESFSAALKASRWQTDAQFEETLTEKPGENAWPITMGTFIIVPQVTKTPSKTIATLQFFTWGFIHGDHFVGSVDLVRLPDRIQARVYREMMTIVDQTGQPLKWSLQ